MLSDSEEVGSKSDLQERIWRAQSHIERAIEILEDPLVDPQLEILRGLDDSDQRWVQGVAHEVKEMRREIPVIGRMFNRLIQIVGTGNYKISTVVRVQSFLEYSASYIGGFISPFPKNYKFFEELYKKVFLHVRSSSESLKD